jgi:hypothetical protein
VAEIAETSITFFSAFSALSAIGQNTHVPSDQFEFGGAIVWRPSQDYIDRSRLVAFMTRHGLRDYGELMQRSTTDLDWFWRAVLDDLGIEFYEPYRDVIDISAGPAHAKWCVGGRMNIVHNCLDKWAGTPTDHRDAIRWEGEEGVTRTLTYAELRREVNRCANGLRALGVARGDRVALFMPMCPELVIAFFAVIKIGGIVLPLFSGYGADAVATRLVDAGAVGASSDRRAAAPARRANASAGSHLVRARVDAIGVERDRMDRRGRAADDHLHLRHHRAPEGSRPHSLRLPDQDRAGHGPLLRRAAR